MGLREALYPGVTRLLGRLGGTAGRKRVQPHERTCIIHAGGHKTGTSSLQAYLAANRKRLLKQGYLIPNTGLSSGNHHRLVKNLAGTPIAPWHASYGDDFAEELKRSDHDHIIISSEGIEALFRDGPVFSELMRSFGSLGYHVRFVYYVRNLPQLMNSRYN
jgi:hypothetical protein